MYIRLDSEDTVNKSWFNRLANPAPLMKELSLMALSAVQKNIENGIKPENAPITQAVKQGSNPLKDTGALRRSLTARHSATEAAVGTNLAYAPLHNPENGQDKTVIRPKKSRFLCLPASRKTRTLFRRYGWSARAVIEGLQKSGVSVYRPYKKGGGARSNVIMAQKKGEKPFAIFILKKSITIPARPFLFLSDEALAAVEKRVDTYYAS